MKYNLASSHISL